MKSQNENKKIDIKMNNYYVDRLNEMDQKIEEEEYAMREGISHKFCKIAFISF